MVCKTMRENAWHIRPPSLDHYRKYKNLREIHALTQCWMEILPPEQRSAPPFSVDIPLEEHIGHLFPNAVLQSLEKEVIHFQKEAFISLVGADPEEHLSNAKIDPLKTKSYERGTSVAQQNQQQENPSTLELRLSSLEKTLLLLKQIPFIASPFLLIRRTETTAEIELKMNTLYFLHLEWMRGFFTGYNSQIKIQYSNQPLRSSMTYKAIKCTITHQQ